jgi:hypothetical protein
MELALQALESQRAVMYDPATSDYFLQYTNGQGVKNGTIYNENGGPGNQFFWDFRNSSAADYYISSVMSTVNHPAVDGTFTDDVTGLPAEHQNAPINMNLTAQEVTDIQYATQLTNQRLIDALVAAGKYNWQAFSAQDGVGAGVSQSSCNSYMQTYCQPQYQAVARTMQFSATSANQSIAAFLITRSPISFLGYGWESDQRDWSTSFLYDAGTPKALCAQIQPGVFTRQWTAGNVTLDCNTWVATLP